MLTVVLHKRCVRAAHDEFMVDIGIMRRYPANVHHNACAHCVFTARKKLFHFTIFQNTARFITQTQSYRYRIGTGNIVDQLKDNIYRNLNLIGKFTRHIKATVTTIERSCDRE